MKNNNLTKLLIFLGLLTPFAIQAQEDGEDESIFELSRFTIQEDEAIGYQALSTLAGTRIKTPLRDLGAAISVITEEFLEDTGAVDASTVLSYGLNTEVSAGEQGNFAGGVDDIDGNGTIVSRGGSRSNPAIGGQRIRGMAPASLTRGYFLTDIPFDSYNTSRVTINRGPNSLLFGVGSVGGIIDNSVKYATIGDNFGQIKIRIGERGGNRQEVDRNQILIKDRLAVRIVALNEKIQFKQRPAYETDQRIHASFEAVLFENEASEFFGKTVLRGNYEEGTIAGTPPKVVPLQDGVSDWFGITIDRSREPLIYHPDSGQALPGYVDNSHDRDGLFSPRKVIITLPSTGTGNHGFPSQNSAWVNIPIAWGDPDQVTPSVGFPGRPEIQGVHARLRYNKIKEAGYDYLKRRDIFNTPMSRAVTQGTGFTAPRVSQSMLDNERILISGKSDHVEHDFDAKTFTLEQTLFNGKGGFELSYDEQMYERDSLLTFDNELRVDTSSHLNNDQPNPNLGKVLLWGHMRPLYVSTAREATRATAFYELDFTDQDGFLGWLGRHTFTGLYNKQTIDRLDRNHRWDWADGTSLGKGEGGDGTVNSIFNINNTGGRKHIVLYNYLTPSLLNGQLSDIKLDNWVDAELPTAGSSYFLGWNHSDKPYYNPNGINMPADLSTYVPGTGDPLYYDTFNVNKQLLSAFRSRQVITSEALSWQSRWWNNNIVGLIGWRTDKSVNTEQAAVGNDDDGEPLPGQQMLGDTSMITEGNTMTKSLVVHLPVDLGSTSISVFYNESENFSPAATRRDIRRNVLPSPTGTTEEIGIGMEFLDGAVSLRMAQYEMSSEYLKAEGLDNAFDHILRPNLTRKWASYRADGVPWEDALAQMYDERNRFPDAKRFNSYDELFTAIASYLPRDIEEGLNRRYVDGDYLFDPIIGGIATRSFTSEGTEVELVGNLTSNWRVSLNVGQQETITGNTAPVLNEVAQQVVEGLMREGLAGHQDAPANDVGEHALGRMGGATLLPIAKARAQDGKVTLEQREWRANLATNYDFTEGALKGFGVGGAYRYQSKVAVGYEQHIPSRELGVVPLIDKPLFGPAEWNGDMWFSYKRPLTDKIDLKVQLNIRNLFGDDDLIPVIINPDGNVAAYRNSNPRDTFITTTFSF